MHRYSLTDPLPSMLAGCQGGNLDHPDLIAGTSLWLPVSLPGGLLYFGDMHAAQGHGETAGGALEISGSATLQIDLLARHTIPSPRYETPSGIGCLAVAPRMEESVRLALAYMIHWMTSAGWQSYDAAMLVQQSCSFRFGGLTTTYAVASCFLEKSKLPGRCLPCP